MSIKQGCKVYITEIHQSNRVFVVWCNRCGNV